jgi:hypothetical protein
LRSLMSKETIASAVRYCALRKQQPPPAAATKGETVRSTARSTRCGVRSGNQTRNRTQGIDQISPHRKTSRTGGERRSIDRRAPARTSSGLLQQRGAADRIGREQAETANWRMENSRGRAQRVARDERRRGGWGVRMNGTVCRWAVLIAGSVRAAIEPAPSDRPVRDAEASIGRPRVVRTGRYVRAVQRRRAALAVSCLGLLAAEVERSLGSRV